MLLLLSTCKILFNDHATTRPDCYYYKQITGKKRRIRYTYRANKVTFFSPIKTSLKLNSNSILMKCKICGTGFFTCSLYIQGQGRQLPFSFLCDIFILLNVNMHVLNVNQSFFMNVTELILCHLIHMKHKFHNHITIDMIYD